MTEVYNGTTNLQYLSSANLYGRMVSHISPWHSCYLEFQTRSTSLLQYRGWDRLFAGSERVSGFPIPRARRIFPCHCKERREMNAARPREWFAFPVLHREPYKGSLLLECDSCDMCRVFEQE